ncbi:MAG: methyltransferase domain-containing protein [Candidatus Binatus sp.]|uniref:methyltransferase domain-containing protein n=1 Tax=Candidatus Binatus sp. TaxID=2811406 RepID=UPI00271B2061|nr:methyltransferase domain-containing protein [Candidatus Binatus sp.]MDO8433037.1 methyltransferase domain-containing protein [Candidatus Binatus sp.]
MRSVERAHQMRRSPARPRDRAAPHPLRFGPNLYIAHTQPGFETIAADEIESRIRGAREITRRAVPDRAGMSIFFAPAPQPIASLRTAEDIFALAGYRAGLAPETSSLEKIRGAARDAPFVEAGVQWRVHFSPGSRAGRRLRFRVVARMAGEHEFRRVDFQRVVERGILERRDHTWRLDEADADVEFWATMIDTEFFITVRLSDDRMRHRDYKTAHRPASLRPATAAALAWLSSPQDDDVVLDPFCGAGTILIERAHLGRYSMLLGSDRDREALAAAEANVGNRYQPIKLENWDAAAIPLEAGSVDAIVTNLPWGIRYGTHGENRKLYPRWFAEFGRVLKSGGRMVLLTAEWRLMRDLERARKIAPEKTYRVSILGTPAAIYVCKKI